MNKKITDNRQPTTDNLKVFILHGWSYNKNKWLKLGEMLTANKINAKILDIPGFDCPIYKPWNIEDYIDWASEIIKNEKSKNICLIGGSNGGRIALNLAIKHPKLIKYLILVDSAGIYNDKFYYRLRVEASKIIAKLGRLFTKSPMLRMLLYRLNQANDYAIASDTMKQTLINLTESDKTLKLNKISIPATIIWGSDDRITPIWMGQKMNHLIANSKLHIIKGARHAPQFTHTPQVLEIVLSCANYVVSNHVLIK